MTFLEEIENFIEWPSKEKLKKEIKDSHTFKESKNFLHKLLKKLEKGTLTRKEKIFLENEIEKHKELKKLYNEFLEEQKNLWNKSKKEINNLFNNYKSSIIWDSTIDYIESQIENWEEKFKFFRDNIISCIDIKWEFEYIYEIKNTKFFINQFTLEYINFLDSKYKNVYEFFQKNKFTNIILNEDDLKTILQKIIIKSIKKWVNLDKTIVFHIIDKNITINPEFIKNNMFVKLKINEEKEKKRYKT